MEKISRGIPVRENLFKNPNKNISFKGLSVETRNDGTKHHTFYTPGSDKMKLEVIPLAMDKNGDYSQKGEKQVLNPEKSDGFMKIWEPSDDKSILNITRPDIKLAYRFVDGKTPVLDEVRRVQVGNDEYNLASDPQRPALKKARSIYHLMPDMLKEGGNDRRNHFNMFGGNINDIRNRLDYIESLGTTRILSTPVFNNGPKNSNGYWTKNPYQVDPIRGSSTDYKNLQVDLYKKGMGFIADGAFINESWEGVHMKDIMKYGKDSPFVNWFVIDDVNKPLTPPLLPHKDNAEALNNLGIKLINSEYQLKYPKNGAEPKVVKNGNYDSSLPTKIQLFDRRSLSLEKQNTDKVVKTYDKTLEDPNRIKNFSDSVQLASFEVDYNHVQKALKKSEGQTVNPRELIVNTDWGRNFELGYPGQGSNISLWDGQNDIAKFRFFTTESEEQKIKNPDELKEIKKAAAQVQDNIVQVGQFWTGQVEKTLSEYTAKELSKELENLNYNSEMGIEQKAGLINQAVSTLSNPKNPLIPKESSKLINAEQIKNLLKSEYNPETKAYDGSYNMDIAPLPANITEGIMSLPLESIDFPDEICSILAGPHVKKLATNPDLIGVSRYELQDRPEYKKEYSSTYRKMDKVYSEKLTPFVMDVINSSGILQSQMPVDENGNFETQEGKEIFRVVADDITKFLVVKAFADTLPTEESLESGKSLEYNSEELAHNSFANWEGRSQATPESEAKSLVRAISKGIDKISDEDGLKLVNYLEKRVEGLNEDTLKVSKLILNKTESGLEWRIDAARDVADMQKVMSGQTPRTQNTFAENWDKVIDFWSKFIGGVKEQNPKYYAIAESSNLHVVYPGDPVNKFVKNTTGKEVPVGNYPNQGSVTSKFIEQTGFTTESNYPYLFSTLPDLANGMDNVFDFMNGKLLKGWGDDNKSDRMPGFLRSAPVDSVLYSHVFTDNHDMMRSLHALSIDKSEFDSGIKATPERLARWNGHKIGENLNDINRFNTDINAILGPMKGIFEEGFDWFNDKSEKEKWNEVAKNWNGGEGNWVEKEIKPQYLDKYLAERAKVEEKAEISQKYTASFIAADKIAQSYEKAANELNISGNTSKVVKQAIDNIATGTFMGKKYADLPEHFGRRDVKHNWRDIVAEAENIDPSVKAELNDNLADKVEQNFTEVGRAKIKAVELFKTILTGSPTMYIGQDTNETGLESYGKNVYLYNRNRVDQNRLNKPFIKDFNNELKQIGSLRKRPELSPLVNGQLIPLNYINNNLYGVYRYNKETDVIALINASGHNETQDGVKVKTQEIPYIDTSRNGEFGVPGGVKDGTEYVNALNKEDEYITANGGKIYSKKYKQPIVIDGPALILHRKKAF